MPSNLTSIVVVDHTTGDHISVWESLESASGVSEEMIIVDMGMDSTAELAVDEFRRLKRCCPVIAYDDIQQMVTNIDFSTKWCVIIFVDEIIHEASSHYIWDLADRHTDEYDGAYLPIYVVFASWEDKSKSGKPFVHDDIRIMNKEILRGLEWNGVKFNVNGSFNIVPSQLSPRPVWKLQLAFSEEKGITPFEFSDEQYAAAPQRVKRLMGRGNYTPPYIFGSGQNIEEDVEYDQYEEKG